MVERHLAKVNVASSNLVFRSIKTESCQSARFCFKNFIWRHSQVVRQRSATPSSPVQIWVAPPEIRTRKCADFYLLSVFYSLNEVFWKVIANKEEIKGVLLCTSKSFFFNVFALGHLIKGFILLKHIFQ